MITTMRSTELKGFAIGMNPIPTQRKIRSNLLGREDAYARIWFSGRITRNLCELLNNAFAYPES